MNAKINNVIYMELYSGAKIVDEKTNIAGSIDREFTVYICTYETNILGGKLLLLIMRTSCIKTCETEIVFYTYFWQS
jgi:hypothetical protein